MILELEQTTVEFYWISAHISIEGNEKVDSLAKAVTSSDSCEITALPFSDFTQYYKKDAFERTLVDAKEQGTSKGKIYFDLYFSDRALAWFKYSNENLNRALIASINRCRSNHYNLAYSLHRQRIIDDPKCKCGNEQEDINHVIWQCPLYKDQRTTMITKLKKLLPDSSCYPLCIEMFLSEPNVKACQIIFTFFEKCKLNI